MSMLADHAPSLHAVPEPAVDAAELVRLEARLPPLLSVIAGMVDLTGFFTLGHVFTAHVTGNLAILASHYAIGSFAEIGPLLAVPVFVAVLSAVTLAELTPFGAFSTAPVSQPGQAAVQAS